MKEVRYYLTQDGKCPFKEWLESLNESVRARVMARISQIPHGGSKRNIKALKGGLFELKMDFGSGYRIYFSEVDGKIILLLCGGDKQSQNRDIVRARSYLRDYVSN